MPLYSGEICYILSLLPGAVLCSCCISYNSKDVPMYTGGVNLVVGGIRLMMECLLLFSKNERNFVCSGHLYDTFCPETNILISKIITRITAS